MSNTTKETCQDCGGAAEAIDGICEDCAENYIYCTVCEEYISINERHRHIFEGNEHGEWLGSGGTDMNEEYEQEIKEALFFVLDKMPTMADPLAHTIKAGKMGYDRIHLVIGLVLGPVIIWCCLIDNNGYLCFFADNFDDLADEIDDEKQQKLLEYCVYWLISLDDKTKDANNLTIKWIAEWQHNQKGQQ